MSHDVKLLLIIFAICALAVGLSFIAARWMPTSYLASQGDLWRRMAERNEAEARDRRYAKGGWPATTDNPGDDRP